MTELDDAASAPLTKPGAETELDDVGIPRAEPGAVNELDDVKASPRAEQGALAELDDVASAPGRAFSATLPKKRPHKAP